jgi:hypothetical protein
MALTTAYVRSRVEGMRSILSGANVTVRHDDVEYDGVSVPFEKGEVVDESGAMFTITGGLRLIVGEFRSVWIKPGDLINIYDTEAKEWKTYVTLASRLDETKATMLVTYGERYDQEGL